MILDNNMLTYHFQPIVSARDGGIFAYEALMRILVPMRMSPPELLESAERLNRLYDVEKLTLFNVVEIVARRYLSTACRGICSTHRTEKNSFQR